MLFFLLFFRPKITKFNFKKRKLILVVMEDNEGAEQTEAKQEHTFVFRWVYLPGHSVMRKNLSHEKVGNKMWRNFKIVGSAHILLPVHSYLILSAVS